MLINTVPTIISATIRTVENFEDFYKGKLLTFRATLLAL